MAELKKNALYVGCGDPRLWDTHNRMRKHLIEERNVKLYNILVPGPDEGAKGNREHFSAVSYLTGYFHSLTEFEELHFFVHEECAGCGATPEEHEKLAMKVINDVVETFGYTGNIFVNIQRKPEGDEYGIWPHELIHASQR